MDVTEQQHIDAVRSRLYQRYPDLDPTTVDGMIYAAHHRFDGCRIRTSSRCWSNAPPSVPSTTPHPPHDRNSGTR